ncbi:MAG TPA: hypothetical protein VNS32_04760, partial [Flavisolibacter sp.]|nr:hypothetical protein [Flavisolibacter sp.]
DLVPVVDLREHVVVRVAADHLRRRPVEVLQAVNSAKSEWVKRELNSAIVKEIERRKTVILPVKLGNAPIPDLIRDKAYADFTVSYKEGFFKLINTIKNG